MMKDTFWGTARAGIPTRLAGILNKNELNDRRYFRNWSLRSTWEAFVAWLKAAP